MGAVGHGHQLEAAQLQHGDVPGFHLPGLRQQRVADVAAQMDGSARSLQQLGDDGGGRRLAVAAGDGDLRAGADVEKDFHLGGQNAPPLHGGGQLRQVGTHAGGAEDNVLRQVLQIVRSQAQPGTLGLQLVPDGPQGRPVLLVAGGDRHAPAQQQLDERPVGDADADDGHSLVLQRCQIFLEFHGIAPYVLRPGAGNCVQENYTADGVKLQCGVKIFRVDIRVCFLYNRWASKTDSRVARPKGRS